jgi:hypothetical protein
MCSSHDFYVLFHVFVCLFLVFVCTYKVTKLVCILCVMDMIMCVIEKFVGGKRFVSPPRHPSRATPEAKT